MPMLGTSHRRITIIHANRTLVNRPVVASFVPAALRRSHVGTVAVRSKASPRMRAEALAAAAVAAWMLAGLVGAAAAKDSQSVAYQLSATHTGHIAAGGLDVPLTQQWSITLPGAISYPLIVNGLVFVTVGDRKLYALNQATGAVVWWRGLGGNTARSGLAYDRGLVLATNFDGDVTAFDPAAGAVIWMKHLPGAYVVTAPPTAANGLLLVGSNGMLTALRGSDGRLMWSQPVWSGGQSSPAIDDQAVYVGYTCHQDYAFSLLSGSLLWRRMGACAGGGGRTPVVADGSVFLREPTTGENLVRSTATGAELGTFSSDRPPAVADGVAFMLSGSTLSAIAGSGLGATVWQFTGDGSLNSAPLVVGDLVFVGSATGMLYALDASAGTTRWSANVGRAMPAPDEWVDDQPLPGLGAANGTLIVPAGDRLFAYRTAGEITAPPSNETPPTIDGSARAGQTLAADVGVWSGLPGSYSYQWRVCDAAGASCTDVGAQTAASFRPAAGDVGATVRVAVAAANASGSSTTVVSGASAVIAAAFPASQTAPAITGTAQVGQTLTADPGTWSASPFTFAYRWLRCDSARLPSCSDIAGATAPTYTAGDDDVGYRLVVRVIATSASGDSDPTDSRLTGEVLPRPPVNVGAPVISDVPYRGQLLVGSTGAWTNSPTSYSYRWRRCTSASSLSCSDIVGATALTYVVDNDDIGYRLMLRVVASNAGGSSGPADSGPTAVVDVVVPVNLTEPGLTGIPEEGKTLAASPGTWRNNPVGYAYQWFTCDANLSGCPVVAGATSSSYVVGRVDIGRYVGVEVVARNAHGESEPVSSETIGPIYPAPPRRLASPSIRGIAQDGRTLSADRGTWTASPTSYSYQWYSCDADVTICDLLAGATAAAFRIGPALVGRRLGVGVVATNAGGDSEEELSDLTNVVLAARSATLPAPPPPASAPATPKLDGTFTLLKISARADGSLLVVARVPGAGKLSAHATVLATSLPTIRCTQRCSARARYGSNSRKAAKATQVRLVIRPNARARRALKRRAMAVRVKVSFQSALGGPPATRQQSVVVRRLRRQPATRLQRRLRALAPRIRAVPATRAAKPATVFAFGILATVDRLPLAVAAQARYSVHRRLAGSARMPTGPGG